MDSKYKLTNRAGIEFSIAFKSIARGTKTAIQLFVDGRLIAPKEYVNEKEARLAAGDFCEGKDV